MSFCSYSGRVVGNGLRAQRQNPEVKVRIPNPTLAEVKETLENFNQVRSIHSAQGRSGTQKIFKSKNVFLNLKEKNCCQGSAFTILVF